MSRTIKTPNGPQPSGYADGIAASGETIYVAGQVGWNGSGAFASDDFAQQAEQALRNVVAVLDAAGGRPEHLVRMTWYVVDKREYVSARKALGAIYREIVGEYYPAMTLVQVSGLLEDRARVEIEATAVIP